MPESNLDQNPLQEENAGKLSLKKAAAAQKGIEDIHEHDGILIAKFKEACDCNMRKFKVGVFSTRGFVSEGSMLNIVLTRQ